MIKNNTIVAVIPARRKSKRLPGKNILPLSGKPLIVWTIETAKKAKYIDRVIVSTNSNEIAEVSKGVQAEVFIRPNKLASDTASTIDVVLNVINSLQEKYNFVLLLQPTSPLRNYTHINEACELLIEKKADAIISTTEMDHSPLWSNTLPLDGDMSNFINHKIIHKRSQDLPVYYRLNGAIFICNTQKLLSEKTFFLKNNIFAYKMDRRSSVDIDNKFDFDYAEYLINKNEIIK